MSARFSGWPRHNFFKKDWIIIASLKKTLKAEIMTFLGLCPEAWSRLHEGTPVTPNSQAAVAGLCLFSCSPV